MKGSCPRLGERPRAQSPDPSWPRFQEQTQAPRACTDSGSGCLGALKGKTSSEIHTPQSHPPSAELGAADAASGHRGEIRFRPRTAPGPCSPAALSRERSVRRPRRLPPLSPARAVPRARAGIAAPTSRPCTPPTPWTPRPAWRGAAPLPRGGSGRLLGPAARGAFFFFLANFLGPRG